LCAFVEDVLEVGAVVEEFLVFRLHGLEARDDGVGEERFELPPGAIEWTDAREGRGGTGKLMECRASVRDKRITTPICCCSSRACSRPRAASYRYCKHSDVLRAPLPRVKDT